MKPAPSEILEAMHALTGAHAGHRALHARGSLCTATFTPTTAAAKLSRAAHFRETVQATVLATVQAVEESIVNAMVAAETMTGVNGRTVPAIDTGELQKILKRFGRLQR